MIDIVIVHPKKYERERLISLLKDHGDINIIGLGEDAYDALKIIASLRPDIAIIDEALGFLDDIGIFPLIKLRSPKTLAVLLAAGINNNRFLKLINENVKGIACINSDIYLLPNIIQTVYNGGSYINPLLASRILHLFSQVNQKYAKKNQEKADIGYSPIAFLETATRFTKTELQILSCLGRSYNNQQISMELDLAYGTVRNCISSIMHKTGLKNRLQLARYAIEYGLVPA